MLPNKALDGPMGRWKGVLPLVLGYAEILFGIGTTVWAVWTVRLIKDYPDPLWWVVHLAWPGMFFVFPGYWLTRKERSRWLPQLMPGIVLAILLVGK